MTGSYGSRTWRLLQSTLMDAQIGGLKRLLEIVETLRGPNGCPWDRAQRLADMPKNLLEECCETIDALESASGEPTDPVCEELGDLLMNIFLCAQIAQEAGAFSMAEVADGICAKLVRRHPHVFGDATAETVDDVLERWNSIKEEERASSARSPRSRLDGVPRSLPPLERAHQLGRAAAKVGFDWPNSNGAFQKVEEELEELKAAAHSPERAEEELGDLLFAVANLCRKMDVPPDRALRRTLKKFESRFRYIEEKLPAMEESSLDELESLWQQAKAVLEGPRSGDNRRKEAE
jgi:MazG family protein